MKMLCFLSHLLLITISTAFGQDAREAEITRLENLEREAVMRSDSTMLYDKLWSPGMVINTPANIVGTVDGTKQHLRSGGLAYASFQRVIEKITFHDNVAIVMGHEVIRPQGTQPNAGKTVTRRFTNIWMYRHNTWSIIGRQATIIKVE